MTMVPVVGPSLIGQQVVFHSKSVAVTKSITGEKGDRAMR